MTKTTMMTFAGEQVVLISQASMPSSCWGTYGRVAVLTAKRDVATLPCAARESADWSVTYRSVPLFVGKSPRCAFAKVLREWCTYLDDKASTQVGSTATIVIGNAKLVRRCGMGEVL